MQNNPDLISYISEFYRTTDTKLNHLTKQIELLKKHITLLYALRTDIADIPPATGHLKMKQQGCLKLLLLIDQVLRDAGIEYFLGYGTLLGAARSGDFIPWDDDIDICLMRADFHRATDILSQRFTHDDFFTTRGLSGGIFKVLFKKNLCRPVSMGYISYPNGNGRPTHGIYKHIHPRNGYRPPVGGGPAHTSR